MNPPGVELDEEEHIDSVKKHGVDMEEVAGQHRRRGSEERRPTNWTMLDYAGTGLYSREEDIYNLANFVKLLEGWQAAKDGAGS